MDKVKFIKKLEKELTIINECLYPLLEQQYKGEGISEIQRELKIILMTERTTLLRVLTMLERF